VQKYRNVDGERIAECGRAMHNTQPPRNRERPAGGWGDCRARCCRGRGPTREFVDQGKELAGRYVLLKATPALDLVA